MRCHDSFDAYMERMHDPVRRRPFDTLLNWAIPLSMLPLFLWAAWLTRGARDAALYAIVGQLMPAWVRQAWE